MNASTANRRILVVDDNEAIHGDFQKILQPPTSSHADVDAEAEALFGAADGPAAATARRVEADFELSFACQGRDALAKVEQARKDGKPFALAFVDMRMPPGWDGLETVTALWKADPEIQTVICTAYSDRTWEEIVDALDVRDRWLVLKKPFDVIEVLQIANALTEKWNLARFADTQRDALERMVEIRTAELVREQRVVREFLMSASHELLTPLNGVLGMLQLLAGEVTDAERQEYVREAEGCAESLHGLIRRILAFNEGEGGRPETPAVPFRPLDLLRECAQHHRRAAAAKGIDIECLALTAPDELWTGPADAVRNALSLLADNAVKFTPQGRISLEAGPTTDGLAFTVRDTGIGLSQAQLEWIRIPFAQADGSAARRHSGIGLGLPLARRWIAAGGGRLEIEGAQGAGVVAGFNVRARRALA